MFISSGESWNSSDGSLVYNGKTSPLTLLPFKRRTQPDILH